MCLLSGSVCLSVSCQVRSAVTGAYELSSRLGVQARATGDTPHLTGANGTFYPNLQAGVDREERRRENAYRHASEEPLLHRAYVMIYVKTQNQRLQSWTHHLMVNHAFSTACTGKEFALNQALVQQPQLT